MGSIEALAAAIEQHVAAIRAAAWNAPPEAAPRGMRSFGMSAMDSSNVSMFWTQKMMADLSMFERQQALAQQAEAKYTSMP